MYHILDEFRLCAKFWGKGFGMKKTEKRIISMLLALVMCVNCAAPALAEDATAAVMRLTKATGTVSVTNSRGKGVSMRDNMRLYSGYHVETQEASYAWIDLDDAKLTKLDAVSELEVRKDGKKLELLLNSGNLYFNVTEPLKNDEALNIRTSTMTTGIRGTSGWVRVVDQRHTQVYVLQGRVECSVTDPVTGQTKTTVLTGGEMAEFVVYEQEKPGDKCDIIRKRFTEDAPGGFILVELTPDKPHRDKIEEDSGLVFPDDPEEAEDRLKQDEEDTHEKLKPILDDYEDQDNEVSKDPVWEDEDEPEEDDSYVADDTPSPPPDLPVDPPVDPTPAAYEINLNGRITDRVRGTPIGGATITISEVTRGLSDYPITLTTDAAGYYAADLTVRSDMAYIVTVEASAEETGLSGPANYVTDIQRKEFTADGSTDLSLAMDVDGCSYFFEDNTKAALTVYGKGNMDTFNSTDDVPWHDYQTNIETVVIEEGITSISPHTFSGCTKLTSIIIPNSVTSIGSQSFNGCTALNNVNIPSSVTSIGYTAFYNCSSLTDITIPSGVNLIGDDTFSGCSSLINVTIENGAASIGNYAFQNCSSLTSITIPESVTSIGAYAFSGCTDLGNVTFRGDSQITSIAAYVFESCTSLRSITIPANVESIGRRAFWGCSSMSSVTFSSNEKLTRIGEDAFSSCYGLTAIAIPDSVTSIGMQAFAYCTNLGTITIPSGVTTIAQATFQRCDNLTSVVIPASVTRIDNLAFNSCSRLTDVYYAGSQTAWDSITIGESNAKLTDTTNPATIHYNSTGPDETP